MKYLDKFIPKEYLALKINYCRQQLELLPKAKVHDRVINGSIIKKVVIDKHRYNLDSQIGNNYYKISQLRDALTRDLDFLEALWNYNYKDVVPTLDAKKTVRTLYVSNNTSVVMDKAYFDSLKNDANDKYPKPSFYPYNGTLYRSAAERSIAVFYTEMGIPFKYEPEVYLIGLRKPVYPDFVPYFKELDSCKFHEHFGIMNSSDYIRDSKIKFGNYTNAGLLQDLDFLFTYNAEDTSLDLRFLSAKINALVFGSMVCNVDGSSRK